MDLDTVRHDTPGIAQRNWNLEISEIMKALFLILSVAVLSTATSGIVNTNRFLGDGVQTEVDVDKPVDDAKPARDHKMKKPFGFNHTGALNFTKGKWSGNGTKWAGKWAGLRNGTKPFNVTRHSLNGTWGTFNATWTRNATKIVLSNVTTAVIHNAVNLAINMTKPILNALPLNITKPSNILEATFGITNHTFGSASNIAKAPITHNLINNAVKVANDAAKAANDAAKTPNGDSLFDTVVNFVTSTAKAIANSSFGKAVTNAVNTVASVFKKLIK